MRVSMPWGVLRNMEDSSLNGGCEEQATRISASKLAVNQKPVHLPMAQLCIKRSRMKPLQIDYFSLAQRSS